LFRSKVWIYIYLFGNVYFTEDGNSTALNHTFLEQLIEERKKFFENLNAGAFLNDQRRLVEDLLDTRFYEKNVHPRVDHNKPTRINISMSLYQILDVDEHSQSIVVNVWMVQNWYDEFLDWNPRDYGMLNKTIVPYNQIWTPDTYLYNSETLERKKTESMMNAILETGYWANDSQGARVQLMFPAIYKLSCAMNVQWFPYDSQNCTFIISSWTHDKATIDYWATYPTVNLRNMAQNDEWDVLEFEFDRVEQSFKCCENPWVMLYAHLVIRRKPLYYVINLVIPTSIITIVAITGFFTPTSTSSERDEKLYLGINTLLTMSIMMLMVCNQMPSTSSYVPLMSWYYMGIIVVIVLGTLMATIVLAIHGQKHHNRPLSRWVRRLVYNRFVDTFVLRPPCALVELWHEFGVVEERRVSMSQLDPLLLQQLDPISRLPPRPRAFFGSISSNISDTSSYSYTTRLATLTRQYTNQVLGVDFNLIRFKYPPSHHARSIKRHKMGRRCALEWEYLANVIDRILLTLFGCITITLFLLLVCFDDLFTVHTRRR
uniref:Acetylcholine receptor subunit alpha-type acr-5 (inferred by orthology to a C. elegans protein) n=1 Tax=Nippostrongylus brasiliensis TaxID=27835 RepID=A0A0N4XDK6_NIPBR